MLKKNNYGFTLVELLVIISIISLLSLAVVANYRSGQKQYALQTSAHKLAQNIRRVQEMAMAAREIDGRINHGIRVEPGKNYYNLISCDIYNNCVNTEEIKLETPIYIEAIFPSAGYLTIKFFPPDPTVIFEPDDNPVSISLNYENGPGKTVKVNKAGLIEVE